MVSIFKRKDKLYVQFNIDGKCIQRSTKLKDTQKNRKFIKSHIIPSLEIKILQGEYNSQQKVSKDFSFYAEKYLNSKTSLKTYSQLRNIVDNQFYKLFKYREIDSIKRYEIKEFAEDRLREASPKRVRTVLNMLVAIFDIAIDYEVISSNVAKNISLPKHDKKEFDPFTQDEVKNILSKSSGWFRTFLAISFFTGARTGEVLALTRNDIDLDNGTISITKGLRNGVIGTPKTKQSVREVPIFSALVPYIEEHLNSNRSIPLFLNPNTGKMFYKSAKLTPFWKSLLEECKIEYRILYSTRHTFITTMLKSSDLNMLDIAQIVGHSNTEMIVRNYAKFIKGEHLNINRDLNIFTDKTTDTMSQTS